MTIAGKPGDELGERDHEQYNETGAVEEIDMRKFLGVIEKGGSTGFRVGQVAKFDKVAGMRLSPPR